MKQKYAIGADIGGSHITCAAVNIETGEILRKSLAGRRVNNQAQAFEIINTWSDCVSDVIKRIGFDDLLGAGFAIPGPFDYVNGVSLIKHKYKNLYGFNIGDAIFSSIEAPDNFKIRFINDASAFAVGEAWAGKAKDYRKSVCVTLGTGLGSAFIKDHVPVVDGTDIPKTGCLYHLPFGESIADDYFSTRWFVKSYKDYTGKEINGVKELSDLAAGDNKVLELFRKFGSDLAGFLAPWLIKFEAEILVTGGNISNAYNLYGQAFEETLKSNGWNGTVSVSELKEDAALLGSAYLFNENFWNDVQKALPLM